MKKNKTDRPGKRLYRKALERLKQKEARLDAYRDRLNAQEKSIKQKEDDLDYAIRTYKKEIARVNKYHPILDMAEDHSQYPITMDSLDYVMNFRIAKPQFVFRKNNRSTEPPGVLKIFFKTKNGPREFFWAFSESMIYDKFSGNSEDMYHFVAKQLIPAIVDELRKNLK